MSLRRLCLAALFLALTASIANAYTLVMRDKRRVEIPNQFIVTESTLTYEAASGIQITIQLSSIDITLTEWANGEQKGSFMLRASAPPQVDNTPQRRPAAARSITNKDLETFRQKRIHSEVAYEKRRKELGLPSSEVQRRLELAAIEDRTRAQLLNMRSRDEESEEYWRGRASSLRTELATNQAQIDFVRRRLDELPTTQSFGGFSTMSPFGAPVLNFPFQNTLTPNVFSTSQMNSGFGVNIGVNPWGQQRRFQYANNRGRYRRGRFSPFGQNVFAVPYQSPDYSYERMELINQLNDLEMNRAGLAVRWRELEEEARRAGAYPGWLRP